MRRVDFCELTLQDQTCSHVSLGCIGLQAHVLFRWTASLSFHDLG